jgi:hypothetical protein
VKYGAGIRELNKEYLIVQIGPRDEDHTPVTRNGPVISTLAMPIMAKILGIESPVSFSSGKKVRVIRYRIYNANLNLSMYYPSPSTPVYRASVMKDIMSVEMIDSEVTEENLETALQEVFESLGIDTDDVKQLDHGTQLGKISYNVDNRVRKNWIYRLTNEYWIYSLGRFALWKNILQDDVYDDARKIREFIESGTHYDFYKHAARS